MSAVRSLFFALALFCLAGPAGAETSGFPPVDSEVVVKARVFDSSSEALRLLRRIRGVPVVKLALDAAQKYVDLQFDEDLLAWIDGETVLAIVRTGDESPLSQLARQHGGVNEYAKVELNLQTLFNAVEMYQLDKNKLPEGISALVPEYLQALPEDPAGVTYELRANADGTWEIRSSFPPELAHLGTAPYIDNTNTLHPETSEDSAPLNLLVGLRVSDKSRANAGIARLLGKLKDVPDVTVESTQDEWTIGTPMFTLKMRLSNRWLVITDNPQLAGPGLDSLEGKAPSMLANPRWQSVAERLPDEHEALVFVDMEGILSHWRGLDVPDPVLREALLSVKAVGGVTSWNDELATSEFFVRLQPPANHPLAELLRYQGREEFPLFRQAPWGSSYIAVLDLNQTFDLAERVASVNDDFAQMWKGAVKNAERVVGLSWKEDILPASTGELAVTYETFDVFVAGVMQAWNERMEPSEEEEPMPEPEGEGGPPTDEPKPPDWVPEGPPPEEPDAAAVAALPYTFVVGLKPGPERQEIIARLRKKLGPQIRLQNHHGTDVYLTKDDQVAYAVHGNYLILSLGGTSRLLYAMVDSLSGRTAGLSRLNSYQAFRQRREGRLLAAAHQKVDDVYSLAKGFILMMAGAEFRAEATALGRWRDSYSYVTIEPDGVRIRSAVYATEQVP